MNLTDDDIRVKCAEVMGKHQYFGVLYPGCRCTACGDRIEEEKHNIPNYSTSVDAALTLCDRLREEGWKCSLENNERYEKWDCTFLKLGRPLAWSDDPSLARAICLAFLKVHQPTEQETR